MFCCFFVVIALCASPPQNNKKPRTPCVPSALSVGWLVFFNIWLRGQGYFYCSAFSLRFYLLSPRGRSFLLLPSNPVIPTKPSEARRCRKTSFCFLCLVASLLADNGVKNKSRLRSNLLAEVGFKCPRGKRDWKGVKRSRRSLRSSQSGHPDKTEQTAEIHSLRYKEPAKSLFSHFFCCYRYFFLPLPSHKEPSEACDFIIRCARVIANDFFL